MPNKAKISNIVRASLEGDYCMLKDVLTYIAKMILLIAPSLIILRMLLMVFPNTGLGLIVALPLTVSKHRIISCNTHLLECSAGEKKTRVVRSSVTL